MSESVHSSTSREPIVGLHGRAADLQAHRTGPAGCGCPRARRGMWQRFVDSARWSTSDAVHYLTLLEIGRRIASREISPVDLTERHAGSHRDDRSHASRATPRCCTTRRWRRSRGEQEIQAGQYRGPLHGVPIA